MNIHDARYGVPRTFAAVMCDNGGFQKKKAFETSPFYRNRATRGFGPLVSEAL